MDLFSIYTQWQNFAATELAEAEVEEAKCEAVVKYQEAAHMVSNWDAKDKVTVARAEFTIAPDVVEARKNHLTAYAMRKMAAVVYDNCDRTCKLLSRELTRRLGRDPWERRQMRWTP